MEVLRPFSRGRVAANATYFGGALTAAFLAACCAGLLTLFGVTSAVVAVGAVELDLVSDYVLFPALGASLLLAYVGYRWKARCESDDG
ncbi:MAG: hypothetical protein ACT4PT_02850 [Methanobacteriota archaeon]